MSKTAAPAKKIRFLSDNRTYVEVFVEGSKVRIDASNTDEKTLNKALKAAKEKDTAKLVELADVPNLNGWAVRQDRIWVKGEFSITAPRKVTHNAETFSLLLNKLVTSECPEVVFNFLSTSGHVTLTEDGDVLFLVSRSPKAAVLEEDDNISTDGNRITAIKGDELLPMSSFVDSKRNYLVRVNPADLVIFNNRVYSTDFTVSMELHDEMANDHYVTVLNGF